MSKTKAEPHGTSSLRFVSIAEMRIDAEAQRRLDPNWVKGHVSKFDPEQLGYIVCNRREDGHFYVIDGQHRVELLRAVGWGDQSIQCECFEGQSQAQEAALFLRRNDRKAVGPYDKFRVAVTAGEPVPCDIDRIVRHQGFAISNQSVKGNITAVVALQKVYNGAGIASQKDGPAALARTLKTLRAAWGDSPSAYQGHIVGGLGLVQLRYNGKLDQAALAEKLAPFTGGAPGLLGKARAIRDMRGRPVDHCVASVIVDTYNKGRRDAGKIADWWA